MCPYYHTRKFLWSDEPGPFIYYFFIRHYNLVMVWYRDLVGWHIITWLI
ncbi:hypothetical protein DSUL_20246 [Desulfovibrionales bacterium]